MVNPSNWHPVHAERVYRGDERRRDCFLRFHRVRRGFHHRGGDAQSATRYAYRHDRQLDHLHAALRSHVGCPDRDEKIHGLSRRFRGRRDGIAVEHVGAGAGQRRSAGRDDLGAACFSTRAAANFHGDGAGRFIARGISRASIRVFARRYITTIWTGIVVGGIAMITDIGSLSDLTNIGTLFAFCSGLLRRNYSPAHRSESAAAIPCPDGPALSDFGCYCSASR